MSHALPPEPGNRLARLPAWLLGSGHIAARGLRFGMVGLLNGAIFVAVTALLVSGFNAPPVPASIAGYLAAVPVSFIGHRRFSFRSNGHWTGEALRFTITQAINIAVTAGSMQASVGGLKVPYYWGMAMAVVLVPLANFIASNFWVFRQQAGPKGNGA